MSIDVSSCIWASIFRNCLSHALYWLFYRYVIVRFQHFHTHNSSSYGDAAAAICVVWIGLLCSMVQWLLCIAMLILCLMAFCCMFGYDISCRRCQHCYWLPLVLNTVLIPYSSFTRLCWNHGIANVYKWNWKFTCVCVWCVYKMAICNMH